MIKAKLFKRSTGQSRVSKRIISIAAAVLTTCAGVTAVPHVSGVGAPVAQAQTADLIESLLSLSSGSAALLGEIGGGTTSPIGQPGSVPEMSNGTTQWVNTWSNGRLRQYMVRIPTNYSASVAAPVLFGFPGANRPPIQFRDMARFHNTSAGSEAILVYPKGVDDVWEGAPYARTPRGEDIAFVQQIIDEIDRTYNVDRSRIYATGHSNGGGMATSLACQLPHVFAGVATVGGAFYNPVDTGCLSTAIPFMFFHGTNDSIMNYEGGVRHNAPYKSVDAMVRSYARRNSCVGQPVQQPISGGKRYIYTCAGGDVELITHSKDHQWPDSSPSASNEVWSFLKRQSL